MSVTENSVFAKGTSAHRSRQMRTLSETHGSFGPSLTTVFVGISAHVDAHTAAVAIAIRDAVYLIDSSVQRLALDTAVRIDNVIEIAMDKVIDNAVANYVIDAIKKYEQDTFSKAIGAGLPDTLASVSPSLCARLWLELDVIAIVAESSSSSSSSRGGSRGGDAQEEDTGFWAHKPVDEQADSMARKCILNFGPSLVPILQVGWRGVVQTDAGFRAVLTSLASHRQTCGASTWSAVTHFADRLKQAKTKTKKTKIAFFSSTPQGGGVALMRHALVRFSRLIGVDLTWYVPKPRPSVFRITKNVHNILQGVSDPALRISHDEKEAIIAWITENANRYWFSEGGPLCPPEEGGADVIIMPGLIPLIKQRTPQRPVLYRSHIQIRSDLVATPGSPQEDVWAFLWDNIRAADMFISHPIPEFVPHNVPRSKVVYLPATTDWLDGLNKRLSPLDTGYYGHLYNAACQAQHMTQLDWPARKYIVQVARFDPAKGIPTVIAAYAEFCRRLDELGELDDTNDIARPQLVVCGNGSVDDPDGSAIYDQTMTQVEAMQTQCPHLAKRDISIMRLDPNDQVLNTLLANAHVVLQLSTREGFEVKVSEALHAGRPVIATRAGGIPLQVKDGENGFLVEPGDAQAVAGHLMDLFQDEELHRKMSEAARTGVSDEVGTVGNALAWYYLAAKWHELGGKTDEKGEGGLAGNGQWVNDMARAEAGFPYVDGENRLPRSYTEV